MRYVSENLKKYMLKDDLQEVVQIDEDLREFLVERGYVNLTIGDYYVNGSRYQFAIINKEKFERLFQEVRVVKDETIKFD